MTSPTSNNEMTVELEIWKPVVGWESRYAISNLGRLKSLVWYGKPGYSGIVASSAGSLDQRGYFQALLRHGNRRWRVQIHRLVADAFLGDRPVGHQVNHRNGIKTDNRVENLEYVTPRENTQHAIRTGLRNQAAVSAAGNEVQRKLSDDDVRKVRKLISDGHRNADIARQLEITKSIVSGIRMGNRWARVQ